MRRFRVAALAGVITAIGVSTVAAQETDFSVSGPADTITVNPGDDVETWARLANKSTEDVEFGLREVMLIPKDEGQLEVVAELDPRWVGAVEVPETVTVPAQTDKQFPVILHVPDGLPPNIYFFGFLAEPPPVTQPDAVVVVNQLVTYYTVEVPGERTGEPAIVSHKIPGFVFGSDVDGTVKVGTPEGMTVYSQVEVQVTSSFSGDTLAVVPTSSKPVLIAENTARTVTYSWHFDGWLYVGHPDLELAWETPDGEKGRSYPGPLVIVVPWKTIIVAAIVVLLVAYAIWRRRRRRRAERTKGKRVPPKRGPTKVAPKEKSPPRSPDLAEV